MEAEDTVMKDKQIAFAKHPNLAYIFCWNYSAWVEERDKRIARDQAEISFPLGKQEGRKEVVEWIKSQEHLLYAPQGNGEVIDHGILLRPGKLEAQLKKWGII